MKGTKTEKQTETKRMKKRLTENVQKQLLKMAANNTEHKKNGTQTSFFCKQTKKTRSKNDRKNTSLSFFEKHTSAVNTSQRPAGARQADTSLGGRARHAQRLVET